MTFSEIPQLICGGAYEVNVGLHYLVGKIELWQTPAEGGLQLCPDFQRGRVWTPAQQTAYLEYFLSGGRSGLTLYFNQPSWMSRRGMLPGDYDDFVLVDGLQRLTALMGFMRDEIPAFGQRCSEFGQPIRMCPNADKLQFNINNLRTRADVLRWYLQMNAGGTPHSTAELERVAGLLAAESQ